MIRNKNAPPSHERLRKRIVDNNPNYPSMKAALMRLDRAAPQYRLISFEKLSLIRNLRLVLAKSLPDAKSPNPITRDRAIRTLNIQLNLPRFRFLNQIPQARRSLLTQLQGTGVTFEGMQHEWEVERPQQWLFEAPFSSSTNFVAAQRTEP
jgi:hypothetical protein